jgi:hypothetical protein
MIIRDYKEREQTAQCDACGDCLDQNFDLESFNELVLLMKTEGWSIKSDGAGGWSHKCMDCKQSRVEAQKELLGI